MPLQAEQKRAVVNEVQELANAALSLVIADACGVKVAEMTALRKEAREQRVVLRVAKNTLVRRAFADTEFRCVQEVLTGPSLFAFSMEDPAAAARLFKAFARENENFSVKVLAINGRLLPAEQLDVLAFLPSREEALARLLGVLQAPMTKLAGTLQSIPRNLACSLAALRKQKDQAA